MENIVFKLVDIGSLPDSYDPFDEEEMFFSTLEEAKSYCYPYHQIIGVDFLTHVSWYCHWKRER